MEKLEMKYERKENGVKETIFQTKDKESIINWTITALYDGAVKRCKIKIDQYYINSDEYCKITATYTRYNPNGAMVKDIYTIKNWNNDWGNFINVCKTFKNNNVELKDGE